jgi:hypothetical protein
VSPVERAEVMARIKGLVADLGVLAEEYAEAVDALGKVVRRSPEGVTA